MSGVSWSGVSCQLESAQTAVLLTAPSAGSQGGRSRGDDVTALSPGRLNSGTTRDGVSQHQVSVFQGNHQWSCRGGAESPLSSPGAQLCDHTATGKKKKNRAGLASACAHTHTPASTCTDYTLVKKQTRNKLGIAYITLAICNLSCRPRKIIEATSQYANRMIISLRRSTKHTPSQAAAENTHRTTLLAISNRGHLLTHFSWKAICPSKKKK